jgi:hypothetical protein
MTKGLKAVTPLTARLLAERTRLKLFFRATILFYYRDRIIKCDARDFPVKRMVCLVIVRLKFYSRFEVDRLTTSNTRPRSPLFENPRREIANSLREGPHTVLPKPTWTLFRFPVVALSRGVPKQLTPFCKGFFNAEPLRCTAFDAKRLQTAGDAWREHNCSQYTVYWLQPGAFL